MWGLLGLRLCNFAADNQPSIPSAYRWQFGYESTYFIRVTDTSRLYGDGEDIDGFANVACGPTRPYSTQPRNEKQSCAYARVKMGTGLNLPGAWVYNPNDSH